MDNKDDLPSLMKKLNELLSKQINVAKQIGEHEAKLTSLKSTQNNIQTEIKTVSQKIESFNN